jgi:two-component system, NtrC family, nitrogen regulation sensor histidine kinase NtrY
MSIRIQQSIESPLPSSAPFRPVKTPRTGPGIVGPLALSLALASTLVTFLVLAGLTPIEPVHDVVVTTLCINILFGAALLGVIVWEFLAIRRSRLNGQAGAQLHARVIALFSIIAAAPAVLLAVIASVTIDRGLDEWFSQRARAIVDNSLVVARSYLDDQIRSIRGEIFAMATDLNRAWPLFEEDRERFKSILHAQASIRGVAAAYIFNKDMEIKEKIVLDTSRTYPLPPPEALTQVDSEEPAVLTPGNQNAIGAILKLTASENGHWLFVVRAVDPRANQYQRMAENAGREYSELETRRFGVKVAFGLMYLVVALTLLLAAIWLGLAFSNRLVAPIRRLMTAAGQVAGGNLYVQVPSGKGQGDLGGLSETFNKMTAQLRNQRNALLEANEQIDQRRRFSQAVLGGVSAGVIGIDGRGNISLMNRAAERLFDVAEAGILGHNIESLSPELAELLKETRQSGLRILQRTVTISHEGRERILNARLSSEQSAAADNDPENGYVLTLDDITELVSAQRTSAWADVARRIAHEIKNPLTPIQLSAERIRRKYGKVIVEDREVFDQCVGTIVRQVDDIKRMVDEFSSFARMPKPAFEQGDILEPIKQVASMMRVGNPDLIIDITGAEPPLMALFDRRLVSQAMTNIIKNAAESVHAVPEDMRGQGLIEVNVSHEGAFIYVDVIDNGIGLPVENRARLLEPYMTTREKGTGLGLAIVAKIAEDHGGKIELMDAPAVGDGGRGACVRLTFAVSAASGKTEQISENKHTAEGL